MKNWREHKMIGQLEMDPKLYKQYLEERKRLWNCRVYQWDWSEVDKFFKDHLHADHEIVAIIDPVPETKRMVIRLIKHGKPPDIENRKSYDKAPTVRNPELVNAHIHTYDYELHGKMRTSFAYPSLGDLISEIGSASMKRGMWSVIYNKYGKLIYRATNKLLARVQKLPSHHFGQWGRTFGDRYFAIIEKGIGARQLIDFMKREGFDVHAVPYTGEEWPVDDRESFKHWDDDPDKYIGIQDFIFIR